MVFRRNEEDEPGFEQFNLLDLFYSPYHVVRQFIADFTYDERIRAERTLFQNVISILTIPFKLIYGMFAFIVTTWSTSRDGFAFIKSLPVLLILGTFGSALLLADFISTEGKRIGRNLGYIEFHAKNNAPENCEMFARKLIKIKPDDTHLYQLGLSYYRNDEYLKAYDVMRSLAPDDAPGLSLAHSWMAQYYANQGRNLFDDQTRQKRINAHLNYAIQTDPENQMAHYSLALFHLKEAEKYKKDEKGYRETLEKAISEFQLVVNAKVNGITRFQLVSIPKLIELQIELTENKDDLKTKLAQEIIRLQPLADIYPNELDIRLTMVRCATLMEDYQRALAIVREGYQLASDDEVKRKIVGLASMVYLDRAAKFEDMTNFEQFRARVQTLCDAVKANPTEKLVYINLLEFVRKESDQPGVINEEWLDASLTGSRAPSILHCLIGFRELSEGNVVTGEKHWRIAEQQFPSSKIVINNMLDVAASEMPDQFDNLFDMITFGIEMFQEQPLFYRTRGIYLVSQGKFEEAISDLVYAAEEIPNIVDVHQHLITCYEKTGRLDLVDQQRGLLDSKMGKLNDSQRKRMEQVISEIKF